MAFDFAIVGIESGWFEVKLSNGTQAVTITDSYYLGTANQAALLAALAELAAVKEGEKWLLWHDEPCGYIWHLRKDGAMMHYQISVAEKEAYRISEDLAQAAVSDVLIGGKAPFIRFLRAVLRAFSLYAGGSKREQYEKEWGAFPDEQLRRVRAAIQSLKAEAPPE